jgi:hypothetical protein
MEKILIIIKFMIKKNNLLSEVKKSLAKCENINKRKTYVITYFVLFFMTTSFQVTTNKS